MAVIIFSQVPLKYTSAQECKCIFLCVIDLDKIYFLAKWHKLVKNSKSRQKYNHLATLIKAVSKYLLHDIIPLILPKSIAY